jgi:hypothetical protein
MEPNNIDKLALLRKPFEAHQISKLPKPFKKDAQKGQCKECGGYHGLPALHLDYVGHAALTDRLLEVDPCWTWEPLSLDDKGLPVLDKDGGLWIKLTICGVTRLGYGDAGDKTGANAMKERIGDALRNAAMRFGAALDLWHKGDLHPAEEEADAPPAQRAETHRPAPQQHVGEPEPDALIIAQLNAAADVAALTKVMNSLPQGDKRLYTGHFNQRMTELKKAA